MRIVLLIFNLIFLCAFGICDLAVQDLLLIENQFQSLATKTKCVKEALSHVLPECATLGIDSVDIALRKLSALKLSICEFENSGIQYPTICRQVTTLNDCGSCITELEKSPQFWTTYSGNYREIGSICYAESLPFEKDQILNLYSNITKLYNEFQFRMRESNSEFETTNQYLMEQMEYVFSKIEQLSLKIVKEGEILKRKNSEYFHELENTLISTLQHTSNLDLDMKDMSGGIINSLAKINSYINEVVQQSELSGVVSKLSEMDEKYIKSYHALTAESERSLSKIQDNLQQINTFAVEGLDASFLLQESLNSNNLAASDLSTSLKESINLISNHNLHLKEDFADALCVLTEKIVIRVSNTIEDINVQLYDSFQSIDNQIYIIEDRLEYMDQKLSNVTMQFDTIIIFFQSSFELLTTNIFVTTVSKFMDMSKKGWKQCMGILSNFRSSILSTFLMFTVGLMGVICFLNTSKTNKNAFSKLITHFILTFIGMLLIIPALKYLYHI
ncbi:nuclear fusion protein Kar5p [[Candida] anglica]|uniref:Nuclear fusion protein KAR5 n=1 Tax=[Candida] anglica TaxID=148631 RepID=A0ABP0EDD9_9ASCO